MQPSTPNQTKTEAALPNSATAPFMDVAPPKNTPPEVTPPATAVPPATPAPIAVAEPGPKAPPADLNDNPEQLINEATAKPAKPIASKKVKAPKQPGDGSATIIFVTIVVLAVLTGLAVFAYLQSTN